MPAFDPVVLMPNALILLLVSVAAMPAATTLPDIRPELPIVVQSEEVPGLDAATLGDVLHEVRDIWRPYVAITVRFENGANESTAPHASRDDGLRVVLTGRTIRPRDTGSLAWIDFVDGQPARTITVSMTAARAMVEQARWKDLPMQALPLSVRRTFLIRTIGRSIAHEIGHFLLRSRAHAARGLMRDYLTPDEIMEPSRANYRLDRADIDRLRQRLVEYAATRRWDREPA